MRSPSVCRGHDRVERCREFVPQRKRPTTGRVMKACSQHPAARGHAMAAPRAFCAPALLAAYAMGATLWAPALVLIAGQFEGVFARFVPGFPFAGAARMLAVLWVLRFALYLVGACARLRLRLRRQRRDREPAFDAGREGAAHRARLVRRAARRRVDRLCGGDADRDRRRPVAGSSLLRSFPRKRESRSFFLTGSPLSRGRAEESVSASILRCARCSSSLAIFFSSSQ